VNSEWPRPEETRPFAPAGPRKGTTQRERIPRGADTDRDGLAALVRVEVRRELDRRRRQQERAADPFALCVANLGRYACRCLSRGSDMSCAFEAAP
jgi:hypothetical protein